MTITLTSLSKNQLTKVGKVAIWIVASVGVSTLVAWLTNNKNFLALAPAINLIGVTLQQVFKQEEDAASEGLPLDDLDDLRTAGDVLASEAGKLAPGTVVKPAPTTTKITVTEGEQSATPASDAVANGPTLPPTNVVQ